MLLKENKYNCYKLFCSDKEFGVSDAEPGLHDPAAHVQAQQEEVCTKRHWIQIIQFLKLSHNPPQQVPAVGTGHSGSTALWSHSCAELLPLTYQCLKSAAWLKSHHMTSGSIWFQGNAEYGKWLAPVCEILVFRRCQEKLSIPKMAIATNSQPQKSVIYLAPSLNTT